MLDVTVSFKSGAKINFICKQNECKLFEQIKYGEVVHFPRYIVNVDEIEYIDYEEIEDPAKTTNDIVQESDILYKNI